MLRHIARHRSIEPRIVDHLDLPPERTKARALVEGERGGMIEGAGMQPEPRERLRPRDLLRAVHQPAAGAGADEFFGKPERNDLALSGLAKIHLEQAFIASLMRQC